MIWSAYLDFKVQQCQIAQIFLSVSLSHLCFHFLSTRLARGLPSSSLCSPGTKILLEIIKLFTFYIKYFLFFP